MLEVSAAWRDSILNPNVSRQFRVTARIDLTGSILISGISGITTPAADETSKPDQLADGIVATDHAYASLDGAWTLGDGKYAASTIYGQTGYVGQQLAGVGGVFAIYEQLTFTMSAPTTINHITLAFDDQLNEYAVDFDIQFMNAAGAEIGRWVVTGNGAPALSITAGSGYAVMNLVKSYRLIVKKWSASGHTCKVTECFSGAVELVTGEDRLLTMTVDEAAESNGSSEVGAVMAGVLNMLLDNADRRYSPQNAEGLVYGIDMRKKRIQTSTGMRHADGSTEMLPMGTYYVDDWAETDGEISLAVKATDMMTALDRVTYKKTSSLTYPATLADLIADVFACAGFGIAFDMDEAYEDLTIPAEPDFNGASCREALRYAAQLMNGSIYQTRDAMIRCTAHIIADGVAEGGLFGTSVLTIGPDACFGGARVTRNTDGPTRVIVKYGTDDALEAVKIDGLEEAKNGITELSVSGNPIAQAFTTTNAHFANLAWSILKYCGHMRKWLNVNMRGDPALEAGDVVTIRDTDGVSRLCRLSQQSMVLDGGLRVTAGARC